MKKSDDTFLTDLAKQFKIAQDLPASEHIRILKKLEKIDSNKLCLILNYFLTLEKNPEVLTYIVKTVSKYQNDLTLDILSDMLLNSNEEKNEERTKLKCEIANALGKSQNSNYVLPLLYVLNNKNEHYKLRLACAEALGKIGSSYAVTPLIDLVTDDEEKSMYLRESAAKALGMLGDMRAIEPLANILENKNGLFGKFTFLKERIIETLTRLGQYGDEKSLRALKNALDDDTACIRIGAIEALSEIDAEKSLPLIERMINDKDEEVARSAIFAIYEIQGKAYLQKLLENEDLQECCIDEIHSILDEIEVDANE